MITKETDLMDQQYVFVLKVLKVLITFYSNHISKIILILASLTKNALFILFFKEIIYLKKFLVFIELYDAIMYYLYYLQIHLYQNVLLSLHYTRVTYLNMEQYFM